MSKKARQSYERAGRRAETLAALYLRAKGYRVLERNFRTRAGEIDIIARKKDLLIAVEVKQRTTLEAAREAITHEAERRISRAMGHFIGARPALQHCGLRFDGIFITGPKWWRWRVHHLPQIA